MAKKKIFSILTTLADFISDSFIKQRGIRTDGNKNWMFKDGVGDVHVVADQIVTDGLVTSYPENHFSPPVLHDVLEVDTADVEEIGNVLCVDDRSSTYGSLKKISLSDLPGTTPVTGNLTATGAIALDQTRQVIGGAAAISHVDTAGYKHVPTGGETGQFLKYGGASGTPAWAEHGLTAEDVHALSGYGLKNYIAKFNAITEVQMSLIYEDDDGKVGIRTDAPLGVLDISSGGTTVVLGADQGEITRTNSIKKIFVVDMPHYLTAQPNIQIMRGESYSGYNELWIGNQSSEKNGPQLITFWLADDDITPATSNNTLVLSYGGAAINGFLNLYGLLDVRNDLIRLRTPKTPANSTATGSTGQICWDANYIYVCYNTNQWGRIALEKTGW